jgi:hypothetical protein
VGTPSGDGSNAVWAMGKKRMAVAADAHEATNITVYSKPEAVKRLIGGWPLQDWWPQCSVCPTTPIMCILLLHAVCGTCLHIQPCVSIYRLQMHTHHPH